MELIPEALSNLNDSRISQLLVTTVDCKNGKYDATVYYDGSDFTKEEQKVINQLLNKANGQVKSYVLSATGWYKCPNFKFKADDALEKSLHMESLFAKIKSDKKDEGEEE